MNFISNLEHSFAYSYFYSFFEDCINVFGTNFTILLVPSFNNTLSKNVAIYSIYVCRSILTTFSSFWIWCLKYGVLLTRDVLPLQGSWDFDRQANLSKISISHTCFFFFFGVVGVGWRITEHGEKKRPVLNNFGLRSWNFNHITLLPTCSRYLLLHNHHSKKYWSKTISTLLCS